MWQCEICTLDNPIEKRRCIACNTRRSVTTTDSTGKNNDHNNSTTTTKATKKLIINNWIRHRKKRKRDEQHQQNDEQLADIDEDVDMKLNQSQPSGCLLIATMNGCDITVVLKYDNNDKTGYSENETSYKSGVATTEQQSTTPTTPITTTLSPDIPRMEMDRTNLNNTTPISIPPHTIETSTTERPLPSSQHSYKNIPTLASSQYSYTDIPDNATSSQHSYTDIPINPTPSQHSYTDIIPRNPNADFFYTPPLSLTMASQLSQPVETDNVINYTNASFTPVHSQQLQVEQEEPLNKETTTTTTTEFTQTHSDDPLPCATTITTELSRHQNTNHIVQGERSKIERSIVASKTNRTTITTNRHDAAFVDPTTRDTVDALSFLPLNETDNNQKVVGKEKEDDENSYDDRDISSLTANCTTTTTNFGFQTAGSKTEIHISTDALKKAKRVLNEIINDDDNNNNNNNNGITMSVDSVIVRKECISDNLATVKYGKFGSDDQDITSSSSFNNSISTTKVGFQTAGFKKEIHVSADALKKANRILHSSSNYNSRDENNNDEEKISKSLVVDHNHCANDHDGNNQAAEVNEVEIDYCDDHNFTSLSNSNTSATIFGFQTAGCKKEIHISTDALKKANRILHTENYALKKANRELHSSSNYNRRDENTNDEDKISNSPVIDHKHCVNGYDGNNQAAEENEVENDFCDDRDFSSLSNSNTSATVISFQTAGCKKEIHISTDAMKKANRILLGDDYDTRQNKINNDQDKISVASAVDRIGCINDNKAKEGEEKCRDGQDATSLSNDNISTTILGFQTAGSKKEIYISTDAINEANRVLHGCSNCKSANDEDNITIGSVIGRRECSNENQAIKKGKENCHGDLDIASLSNNNIAATFVGFQTAGCKNEILITSDALKTANRILNSSSDCGLIDKNNLSNPHLHEPLSDSGTRSPPTIVPSTGQMFMALQASDNKIDKIHSPYNSQLLNSTADLEGKRNLSDGNIRIGKRDYSTLCINDTNTAIPHPSLPNEKLEPVNNRHVSDGISIKNVVSITTVRKSRGVQLAPSSCRSSFSVSSMVKGLFSSFEDGRNKSPLPLNKTNVASVHGEVGDETIGYVEKESESVESRPEKSIGMLTPAQRNDMPSSCFHRPFVTPGSCDGKDEWSDPGFITEHLSLETTIKGLMVSTDCQCGDVNPIILEIDSMNAILLRFNRKTLLPDTLLSNNSYDSSDLIGSLPDYREALSMLQCDINYIADTWLANHIRWIIWKLASAERKFALNLAGICLTFKGVVTQLHYRYDKEIRYGARPAVRKLLNRDISAGCMFILCVARIKRHESSHLKDDKEQGDETHGDIKYLLELTDGWYSLPATTDNGLCDFISKGTIEIGTKLLVSNSSLCGSDEGIDPLDSTFDPFNPCKSPVLHISINSCRLARWNSKLGLVKPNAFGTFDGMLLVKKVSDVRDKGGQIPLIDLRVVRRFPLSYLNRQISPLGTKTSILTEHDEHARVETYEKQKQSLLDAFSEEFQALCEKDVDDKAPVAWKNLMNEVSPDFFEGLDEDAKSDINRWKLHRVALIHARMQKELENKLTELDFEEIKPSKPFLKVLVSSDISGCTDAAKCGTDEALVTIWNPSSEQLDLLQVGAVLRMKNLDTKSPCFEGLQQFSGGPGTTFFPLLPDLPNEAKANLQRYCTSLFSLQLQTKRFLKDSSKDRRRSNDVVTVVGVLLCARKSENLVEWIVYLTDKSQCVIRIHCENTCVALRRFLMYSEYGLSSGTPAVVEFGRICIMYFDDMEHCTVAKYSRDSIFTENPGGDLTTSLRGWSTSDHGYNSILKRKSYVDVGVQEISNFDGQRHHAIGYISGLIVLSCQPELFVKVDCGSSYLHTWRFPLALIPSCMDACGFEEPCNDIALNEYEEVQLTKLTKIGYLYGARKKMFHFKLKMISTVPKAHGCNLEVFHVSSIETNALTALYVQLR